MKSLLAVVAGTVFIVVVILLLELIYLFAAVAYNSWVLEYPFLEHLTFIFRYLIGFPAILLTMFFGGYITASIAKMATTLSLGLHCFALGLIAVITTLYSALAYSELTATGFVMIMLTFVMTSAGGFYWRRVTCRNKNTQSDLAEE